MLLCKEIKIMTLKRHKRLFYGTESSGRARPTIEIRAGKMKSIPIQVGSLSGRVYALIIKQVSGTAIPYTVELLESLAPYHNGVDGNLERPYSDPPDAPIELYRAIPKQTAAAGAAVEWRNEPGYGYYNLDADYNDIKSNFLYLTIIPNNAATITNWVAAIETECY